MYYAHQEICLVTQVQELVLVVIIYFFDGVFLHYGTEADFVSQTNWGMKFYATNIVLNGCPTAANFIFVQLGTIQAEHNFIDGTSERFSGTGLDLRYPADDYQAFNPWWHTYDSPGEKADNSIQTWRSDHFTMYLLYQT
jgi:hypothetical protein